MLPNEAEMDMPIMFAFTDLNMGIVRIEGAKSPRVHYIHGVNIEHVASKTSGA
jgi:hypothetical protein